MRVPYEEKVGDAMIRIIARGREYQGAVIRKGQRFALTEDSEAERLRARLRNEVGKLHPDYVGMSGAIARFLSFFPLGFSDPLFIADERAYKERASDRLRTMLPLEDAVKASPTQAAQVRAVYATNLLSSFELARSSAVLRGPTGADFVQGAAQFALGNYAAGLTAMTQAVAPQGRISWPIATYLPSLWQPDRHMFLKPTATRSFAERIGHDFQYRYEASLAAPVYLALLDLLTDTEAALSELQPQSRIDVQSFIWVVGDYDDAAMRDLDRRREAA